jgi:hypothetical protein
VLESLERLALDIVWKNCTFRASAFSEGVIAIPVDITKLEIDSGVRGRWLLVLAHFAVIIYHFSLFQPQLQLA